MALIQELHAAELPAAAQLLARGMRDDPIHLAVFGPDPDHRLDRLGRFFAALLPVLGHPALSAWDAGQLVGVFSLFPPGTCKTPLLKQIRIVCPLLSLNTSELWRLRRWMHASEAHDLPERHWHLGPVGVDMHLQGQGFGSEMLKVFCHRMDEQGEVAFLETDKLAAVRFYARGGFEVIAEGEILGTPCWWMRRPTRPR